MGGGLVCPPPSGSASVHLFSALVIITSFWVTLARERDGGRSVLVLTSFYASFVYLELGKLFVLHSSCTLTYPVTPLPLQIPSSTGQKLPVLSTYVSSWSTAVRDLAPCRRIARESAARWCKLARALITCGTYCTIRTCEAFFFFPHPRQFFFRQVVVT